MTKFEDRCQLIAVILRWIARLSSLVIALVFIIFFIGEFDFSSILALSAIEYVLLSFIPLLYLLGIGVALKYELIGGILMTISVIGYNVSSMIYYHTGILEMDFIYLLIPGILFITLAIFESMYKKKGC